MAGNPHPVFQDGVPVQKGNARAYLPLRLGNPDALRALDGSTFWLCYIQTLVAFFYRDTSDTTSEDNGASIIVDGSGGIWKIISSGAGIAINAAGPVADRGGFDSEDPGFTYFGTDTSLLYVRVNGGGWSAGSSLTGPAGDDGKAGATWLSGSTDPSSGSGNDGDFYFQTGTGSSGVAGDTWKKAAGSWSKQINLRGPAGADSTVPGPANTLTIGTVTGGDTAAASITGTAPDQTLNLTLPKGDPGDDGAAATITIGTVTTGSAGSSASVTNSGTSDAAVLDFTIPRGDTGASGSGTGDMLESMYDPDGKHADAFSQDNMADGATNKNFTATEKTKLAGLDASNFATSAQGSKADGAQQASEKGQPDGYASLDSGGKVPASQLPSYVDDVLEYTNLAAFPGTGETGKIYTALDTSKIYRWSGSVYVEIAASPGSTDSVTEGSTNLYFTAQRVRDAVLTSLSTATNAAITATDTVLAAFGKLQAQISGWASATLTLTNKTISGADNTLTVREADLSLSDVTTGNASTSRHGLVPKLPNDSTKFLDGTGGFSVPSGGGSSGGLVSVSTVTSAGTITIPAGATKAIVTMVGGSGATDGNSGAGHGAGGLIKYLSGLTPGNTLTAAVGAAGSGGTAGGTTSLSSGTQTISTLTCTGGGSQGGGSPGTATGGDINRNGTAGVFYTNNYDTSHFTIGGLSGLGLSSAFNTTNNGVPGFIRIEWYS